MPSSASTAFLVFALVLALAGAATVAIIAGAIGLALELIFVYLAGRV